MQSGKQFLTQQGGSTTRRHVLKTTGGIAVGLFATRWIDGTSAAQEASPVSGGPVGLEGQYALVRRRTLKEGVDAEEINQIIEEGYLPLLREVPGFVAYLATHDPNDVTSTYTVIFEDKAGAEQSNVVAREWLTANQYDWFDGDPEVSEGVIDIAVGSLTGVPATNSEASPVAAEPLEGSYLVLRARKLKPDSSADELADLIREGFVPLVESTPGFIAYVAVSEGATRDQFSLGIFDDKEGADESTRRAAEWGTSGANEYVEGDPLVEEGIIDIAATA